MIYAADPAVVALVSLLMLAVFEYMTWRRERRMKDKIIGIPPRTKLHVIVRHDDEMWIVWTGVDDMQVPYKEWRGTYIALYDNGTAYRCIVEPDGSEDIIRIM